MTTTSIEWTATRHSDGTVTQGKTWNPLRGCRRVSEGCRNCYAERVAARFSGEYYVAWDWGVPQRGYYNTRPFDDFDHAADAARRLNEEWPGSRAHVCEARYGYLVEIQGP